MDTTAKTHPAIIVAAISVTIAALTAIGSQLGLLPAQATPATPASAPLVAEAAATPAPAMQAVHAATQRAHAARVSAVSPKLTSTRTAAPGSDDALPRPAAPASPVAATKVQSADTSVTEFAGTQPVAPVCPDCAIVTRVREATRDGDGSGLGAVAGGVVGGIVGNRFGKGSGRDLLTVLGAAGGAFAGHQIEKTQRRSTVQEVTVRFADGHTQVLTETTPRWNEGDRVRVRDDQLVAL